MKKIAFVFDQVRHFHVPLFQQLDKRLAAAGIELHLFRGEEDAAHARGSVREKVIQNEIPFTLHDYKVRTYTVRLAMGYIDSIRHLKPDVVVCPAHPGDLGHWRLIRLKRSLGFKLVAWQCGYEYNPGRLKHTLLKFFVPGFDCHLAYHGNALRYALENGASQNQVTVMHNTINEARFVITEKQVALASLRQLHPEIGKRRIVLYVGAVLAEKKLERILEAMTILGRSDVVFLVVGDGPHLPVLREIASGRTDVIFAGQVIEGVGTYFDAAEVYVLPGTGGLGINEAMAHSLPIISGYADGSADDLVIDGENGFRLRENTTEELMDRIARILDNPKMAASMGAKSRDWITGKFSFQSFLDRVEGALLAQLANAAAPHNVSVLLPVGQTGDKKTESTGH